MSIADELGELALKHGAIEVDLMGDGLAWRLPGGKTWAALRHEPPAEVAALVERLRASATFRAEGKFAPVGFIEWEAADTLTTLDRQLTIAKAEAEALRRAVEQAAVRFDGYADSHAAQARDADNTYDRTQRMEKAKRNRDRADRLRNFLTSTDARGGE